MANCPKCKGKMVSAGVMHSGNSKYNIERCEKCGHEEMKCTGLA
ncbi:zf-TFIIB domain-containing protein [Candidatus Woesearchaeota archaeon]|nr:zf-TFIIB domain-containing protein [Candidatus Woesearchaeota archaeon]